MRVIYGDTKYELAVCKIFADMTSRGKYGNIFEYLPVLFPGTNPYFVSSIQFL